MYGLIPQFIDVFMMPVRDNLIAQSALFAVLVLILLDVVFGVANACFHGRFSSTELRKGLMHKMGELALVIVGVIIDGLIFAGLDIGFSGPILVTTLVCLVVMEVGSLMEIAADMNPNLEELTIFKALESVKAPKSGAHEEV